MLKLLLDRAYSEFNPGILSDIFSYNLLSLNSQEPK